MNDFVGPWHINACQWNHIHDAKGRWIAAVTVESVDFPQAEANARLISAAPDLLIACEAFIRNLDDIDERLSLAAIVAGMRAAIAKATSPKE